VSVSGQSKKSKYTEYHGRQDHGVPVFGIVSIEIAAILRKSENIIRVSNAMQMEYDSNSSCDACHGNLRTFDRQSRDHSPIANLVEQEPLKNRDHDKKCVRDAYQ